MTQAQSDLLRLSLLFSVLWTFELDSFSLVKEHDGFTKEANKLYDFHPFLSQGKPVETLGRKATGAKAIRSCQPVAKE